MSNNKNGNSMGIGFFGLLTLLFIGLKLTGCITWSWWWVLAPIWGPIALAVAIMFLVVLITIIISLFR